MASQVARRVGANLRRLREERGLTQHQLALKVGANGQQVSNWERGANRPADDTLDALAANLGVPLAALFEDTDAPQVA